MQLFCIRVLSLSLVTLAIAQAREWCHRGSSVPVLQEELRAGLERALFEACYNTTTLFCNQVMIQDLSCTDDQLTATIQGVDIAALGQGNASCSGLVPQEVNGTKIKSCAEVSPPPFKLNKIILQSLAVAILVLLIIMVVTGTLFIWKVIKWKRNKVIRDPEEPPTEEDSERPNNQSVTLSHVERNPQDQSHVLSLTPQLPHQPERFPSSHPPSYTSSRGYVSATTSHGDSHISSHCPHCQHCCHMHLAETASSYTSPQEDSGIVLLPLRFPQPPQKASPFSHHIPAGAVIYYPPKQAYQGPFTGFNTHRTIHSGPASV